MSKISALFCLSILTIMLCTQACDNDDCGAKGNGTLIVENRPVANFTAVEILGSGELNIRQDSSYSVRVQIEENIAPYLVTEVENGILKIFFDRNVCDADNLVIDIDMPELTGLGLNGTIVNNVSGTFSGNQVSLNAAGTCSLNFEEMNYQQIESNLGGVINLTMAGTCDQLTLNMSGTCNVEALDCMAQDVDINFSGAGTARVFAALTLDVVIAGTGSVLYLGDPMVTSQITGTGTVGPL